MWVPKPEEFCTHNAWKNALNDKSYPGWVRRYLHLEIRPNINSAIVDDESESVELRMAIEEEPIDSIRTRKMGQGSLCLFWRRKSSLWFEKLDLSQLGVAGALRGRLFILSLSLPLFLSRGFVVSLSYLDIVTWVPRHGQTKYDTLWHTWGRDAFTNILLKGAFGSEKFINLYLWLKNC